MRGLLQRVEKASVSVNGTVIGSIDTGILLLLGIEKQDNEVSAVRLLNKVLHYRVFSDEQDKMNLSLQNVGGGLLVVSQFTLVADTRKGLRPGFSAGASSEQGRQLYDVFVQKAKLMHSRVETGAFGADMKVSLINDGPVTFMLKA
ncbi:D-aminoacyl-tRNA deacylase [invertebrate metagenome]|uniref:D-aminoacyl-tRNA deacylase n=1 Tax=invertebrate metagenome TaxID=1711999 RepID=A0A2H9TD10_9ZZZZ